MKRIILALQINFYRDFVQCLKNSIVKIFKTAAEKLKHKS